MGGSGPGPYTGHKGGPPPPHAPPLGPGGPPPPGAYPSGPPPPKPGPGPPGSRTKFLSKEEFYREKQRLLEEEMSRTKAYST